MLVLFSFFFLSFLNTLIASIPKDLLDELKSFTEAMKKQYLQEAAPYKEEKVVVTPIDLFLGPPISTVDLVFDLYLCAKRCKNDILTFTCLLDSLHYDYLTTVYPKRVNVSQTLPTLRRVDYWIDAGYIDLIEQRNDDVRKVALQLKGADREFALRFDKIMIEAIKSLRDSLKTLHAPDKIRDPGRYLTSFRSVRAILNTESYSVSSVTNGGVLKTPSVYLKSRKTFIIP